MERIKMNTLTLCILIFVFVYNFLFCVGINWTKYNYESYFAGYRCVPSETIFERFNVYGSYACGKLCHVTDQCVSYLYQPDNHLCIGCRVYGAIWAGHYDDLPGSEYLARPCGQEYKRVGYMSDLWIHIDGSVKYTFDSLDAKLCTHIILDIFHTWYDFSSSSRSKPNPTDEEIIKKLQQLKVSNPCLKTLLAVTVEDSSMEIIISFLRTYGFNGIDIQDMLQKPDVTQNLVDKVKEMKQTFDDNGYLLTAALPTRKDGTDVKPLIEHLEFVRVETQDDSTNSGYDKTFIFNPLYQSSQVSNGQQFSMNSNAEYWISKGVPKKKLILVIAAHGNVFELKNEEENQIGAPALGLRRPLKYYEICQMQEEGLGIQRWDDEQKSPYYINGTFWISYDNVRSTSEKMHWLKEKGYGGVWLFGLSDDDFKPVCKSSGRPHPLLSVIYDILTSG